MALTQIGKYQIIKQLGQGGFGAVYLAEAPGLNTQVAIKVFNIRDPKLAQHVTSATSKAGKVLRERFLNEARILRDLEINPNIVNIYDFDQLEDGTPYYVMPYLTHSLVDDIGKDALTTAALKELEPEYRPRKLPVGRATQILEQVLFGLTAVHKAGLIHRDIKPANILFDKHGNAQLCDFGIAKAPDSNHSNIGDVLGSRNYMSPEQRVSAKHVTTRSDVYSVGVMAYRMLTGTLPVDRYEDPIVLSPSIGQALNDLLLAAISNDEEKRPANAGEFLKRLQQAAQQTDANAPEVSEYSGTDISEAPQVISNEFKPLQDKIQGFLLETITLNDDQRKQLTIAANVLGVDKKQLDNLIVATEKQMEPQLKPLKNYIAAVDTQLKENNGELPKSQQALLIQVAEQAGQKRTILEALLAQRVAAFKKHNPVKTVAEKPPESQLTKTQSAKTQQTKPQPPIPQSIRRERVPPQPQQQETSTSEPEVPLSNTPVYGVIVAMLIGAGGYWLTNQSDDDVPVQAPTPVVEEDGTAGFVKIPVGRFQMGSYNGYDDEKPVHTVTIKSFYLQEREVTFADWDRCVAAGGCSHKPSDEGWGRGSRPVINVSYNDIIQQYIPWLNRRTGHNYRLPTEAEWEYAARATSTTKFSWGNNINCSQARYDYYEGDCGNEQKTVPVKSYRANQWGLYDMHGNVYEWTADCWNDSYTGAPGNGNAWTGGDCSGRVLRGGSWNSEPEFLRSAYRGRYVRSKRNYGNGFRLARDK